MLCSIFTMFNLSNKNKIKSSKQTAAMTFQNKKGADNNANNHLVALESSKGLNKNSARLKRYIPKQGMKCSTSPHIKDSKLLLNPLSTFNKCKNASKSHHFESMVPALKTTISTKSKKTNIPQSQLTPVR